MIIKIRCGKCKNDTKTRKVIKRNPLKKLGSVDGYLEYYCCNIIRFKKRGRGINNWIEEECRNRMLVEDNKFLE
ncbi:hypothetical protein LCGC14_0546630 [marine sediment metagenome]|uniref:Uncharacterized protein n=1 Tax=marine sediment metagenome TaxID=412755 RepID=A0A0F9UZE6_9ZZZZ